VELAKALSDRLGRVLDETLLWNFATIGALVEHLETAPAAPETRQPPPAPNTGPSPDTGSSMQVKTSLEDEIAKLERELKRR
jgi:hypothetical protein